MKRRTRDHPPIKPPWQECPECGHSELSHAHEGEGFKCVVFECSCSWAPEKE